MELSRMRAEIKRMQVERTSAFFARELK